MLLLLNIFVILGMKKIKCNIFEFTRRQWTDTEFPHKKLYLIIAIYSLNKKF